MTIISVPLFDEVSFRMGENTFRIRKSGDGCKIREIRCGGSALDGYFVDHESLARGEDLEIVTE